MKKKQEPQIFPQISSSEKFHAKQSPFLARKFHVAGKMLGTAIP